MFGNLGAMFGYTGKVQSLGTFSDFASSVDSVDLFQGVTTPVTAGFAWTDWMNDIKTGTLNIFGFEIKTPQAWAGDKIKESIGDMFIDYLTVSPIVFGVAGAVYVLLGMFSKTLAKLGAIGVVLYSGVVFIFM